jgi:hypothetical protein
LAGAYRTAAREAALKKAENAQANIANEQARRARSQRITRWVITAAGAIILIGGGIVAYLQWDKGHQLDHAKANVLAELSAAKLLRGELDSALRLASHGTRIDLALPSDVVNASPGAAALATAVSAANWRSALGGRVTTVRSATFSPDGSRILTTSRDKTARIWDAMTAKEIAVLRGHDNWVNSGAFSPDGSRVAHQSATTTAGRRPRWTRAPALSPSATTFRPATSAATSICRPTTRSL